jgi:hypothetical protein
VRVRQSAYPIIRIYAHSRSSHLCTGGVGLGVEGMEVVCYEVVLSINYVNVDIVMLYECHVGGGTS